MRTVDAIVGGRVQGILGEWQLLAVVGSIPKGLHATGLAY